MNNQEKMIKKSFMADLLFQACNNIGAKLLMGPKLGANGQILFTKDNKRVSFFNCCFDVNPYGSSLIARNKGLTRLILEKENIKFPEGKYFSTEIDKYHDCTIDDINKEIIEFAKKINFPIMIKGADIHRGVCVHKVDNAEEINQILTKVWKMTKHIVVEKYIFSNSFRLIVFDGQIIASYKKSPPSITGDGMSTIEMLLEQLHGEYGENNSKKYSKILEKVYEKLTKENLKKDYVVPAGQIIKLLDTSNSSTGGSVLDVTNIIHKDYVCYVRKIMKSLNLRLAGIDLLTQDIQSDPGESFLLEVNSSPALEFYSIIGDLQEKKILKLMEEIIMEMKKQL